MRSDVKGIDDIEVSFLEVLAIASGDGQAVHQRCRCDETVLDRHRPTEAAESCEQLGPTKAGGRVPGETIHSPGATLKPLLQSGPPTPFCHQQNAEPQLAENNGIDHELALVSTKPLECTGVRPRFGGLAEDVGVNQVPHKSSVDPDSIGTK